MDFLPGSFAPSNRTSYSSSSSSSASNFSMSSPKLSSEFATPPTRSYRRMAVSNSPLPSKINMLVSPPLAVGPTSGANVTRLGGTVTPPTVQLPLSPPPSCVQQETILLPPSRLVSPKTIFHQLSYQVRHRISDIATEVQIHHVSPANFDAFLMLHGESPNLKGIKLEYDSASLRIIMYPPPAAYHECTPVFLQSVLIGLRNTTFDTPERQRSLGIRAIGYRSRDGSYMVPDAAVAVMPRGGSPRLWPTIVVEVANSQSYESVLAKVTRWFRKSHGMIEVALLLKFTAKEPLVDPACFLEVWRYGVVPAVETDCDGSVPVDSASGSSCDGGGEKDNDIAEGLLHHEDNGDSLLSSREEGLELDFHQDESNSHHADLSDSSLSTVEDETEPDFLLTLPAASTPSELESESNSSGLEDGERESNSSSLENEENESDSPAEPATDSSDSSAGSSSAYQPSARPRQRHIYLSRTRQTIFPVTDSADPETRYLTLRYSDFFGSENVPNGRDGAEEVRLDLDELREEIRGLMRLTAMQEEGVKRYAANGNGRGRKRVKR